MFRRIRPVNLDKVDLNKLRTFAEVASAGGVSRAARQLSLTRSAVSQSLGRARVARWRAPVRPRWRRLVPTQEGRTPERHFGRVHEELREALAEVANVERAVRGVVRLGLFPGASRAQVARAVASFSAKNAHAQVKLGFGSHAELREGLVGNRLDFALSVQRGRDASARIRSSVLLRQTLLLVSSERPPRGALDPDWIARRAIVDYYPTSPLIRRWLAHHFPRRRVAANVRVWAATTDLALELALLGAGATVVPHSLAEPFLRAGRLHEIRGPRAELDDIWLESPRARRNATHGGVPRDACLRARGRDVTPFSVALESAPRERVPTLLAARACSAPAAPST
jgi:DNA-binding transcriptional LysR family regulator